MRQRLFKLRAYDRCDFAEAEVYEEGIGDLEELLCDRVSLSESELVEV